MKKFMGIIGLLFFLGACHKQESESIADFTQRDSEGKNAGNIDTTDWQLYVFDKAPLELQTLAKNYLLDTFFLKSNSIPTIYKTSSQNLFKDTIVFYPNAMTIGGVGFFKMYTTFSNNGIVYALTSKKTGKLISKDGSYFTSQQFLQMLVQSYQVEDKSFTLTYGLFSKDSVLYIGKGDVMVK